MAVGFAYTVALCAGSAVALAADEPSEKPVDDTKYVETSPRPGIQERLEAVSDKIDSRLGSILGGVAVDVDRNAVTVWLRARCLPTSRRSQTRLGLFT